MHQTFSGKRILSGLALGTMIGATMIASTMAAFADNEVNQRQRDQQARIAQGVGNGSMTAHETAKVEGQEAAIHHEVRTERQANGGKLTPAERAQVNRQQNHTSREISAISTTQRSSSVTLHHAVSHGRRGSPRASASAVTKS